MRALPAVVMALVSLVVLSSFVVPGSTGAASERGAVLSPAVACQGGSGSDVGASADAVTAVAAADFDNDGYVDLVSGSGPLEVNDIVVWRNDGTPFSGLWTRNDVGASTSYVNSVAAGDLDRDGFTDIVTGLNDLGEDLQLVIWRNDGTPFSGPWTSHELGTAQPAFDVAVADFDNDGFLDIVVARGYASPSVTVWRNDGTPWDGGWTETPVGSVVDAASAVATGDLDYDAWIDVVVGTYTGEIFAFRNDGTPWDGTWSQYQMGAISGTNPDLRSVDTGDADHDGYPEIISAYNENAPSIAGVHIWKRQTTPWGPWTSNLVADAGIESNFPHEARFGDFDNDGWLDVAVGWYNGSVDIFVNDGTPMTGLWARSRVGAASAPVITVAVADFDKDGFTDVVTGGESSGAYQLIAWRTAFASPSCLSAPRNLQATPGDARVELTWEAPSSDGGFPITGYNVYRDTASGGESSLVALGNILAYTDSGLTNGVTYYYELAAVNEVGEGPLSAEAAATPATPASLPSAPWGLEASAGDGLVTLAWNAPTSDGGAAITGYSIYRGGGAGAESYLTTVGNVLTHTDTGLTNGLVYYYAVSAVNAVGEGDRSEEVSAIPTSGATAPSSPLNLRTSPDWASVTLTWEAPSSDGGAAITNYNVYRGVSSGGESLIAQVGNVLTYTDAGLTNLVEYFYQVSAVNAAGEGLRSSEASAIPPGGPSDPEPNDDFSTAVPIGPGSHLGTLGLNPDTDAHDFYGVVVGGGQTLLVTLMHAPGAMRPIGLALYDDSETLVRDTALTLYAGQSANAGWTLDSRQAQRTYYVQVYSDPDPTGTGYYTLDVALTSQNDAASGGDATDYPGSGEPMPSNPTPLGEGWADGYLNGQTGYDVGDVYGLNLPGYHRIDVTVTAASTLDINLYLLNATSHEEWDYLDSDLGHVGGEAAEVSWLSPDADYVYVWVQQANGQGTYTIRVNVTSVPPPNAVTVYAPTGVTSTSVTLTWAESTDPNFGWYEIYVSAVAGSIGEFIDTVDFQAITEATIYGLEPGTTYYFTVRVVTLDGLYSDSVQVSATTAGRGAAAGGPLGLAIGLLALVIAVPVAVILIAVLLFVVVRRRRRAPAEVLAPPAPPVGGVLEPRSKQVSAGILKPAVQEQEWRLRGTPAELRGLVATAMEQSGFSIEEEDASPEGAPYAGVALHQKVKIGMTYGSMAHRSGGDLFGFGREGAKTGAAKLGETNRLHLWYYAQGEETLVHARAVGMGKNLTKAFGALESTFASRGPSASAPPP